MNALARVVVGLVAAPITALINAWAMSTIWSWFVQPQFGAGPSSAAWYGLASIVSLVLIPAAIATTNDKNRQPDDSLARTIALPIGLWLVALSAVAVSWVTGQILGWI